MSNVTEIKMLINAALTSNHENDSIAVQPTDLVIKHIGTMDSPNTNEKERCMCM